ncbi:hypothetical protein N7486_005988 [Penicillium sp. IBT 16267x]|nr:hypothetical protein N7486_005988 [Penicillium sp. IBT 16267x]
MESTLDTSNQSLEKGTSSLQAQSFMLAEYNGSSTPSPDIESWATFSPPSEAYYRQDGYERSYPLTERDAHTLYEKIIALCGEICDLKAQ